MSRIITYHLERKGAGSVDHDLPDKRVLVVFVAEKLDKLDIVGLGSRSKGGEFGARDARKRGRWTGKTSETERRRSHGTSRLEKGSIPNWKLWSGIDGAVH
jgi:hypothetical protein